MSKQRYRLDSQIGFVLRKAQQRHVSIFSTTMNEGLTPQQFASLAKIAEVGPCSQNSLARQTAMDQSTMAGIIARLRDRGLIKTSETPEDRRMIKIELTLEGERAIRRALPFGHEVTRMTLAPLSRAEQGALLRLLRRIV